MKSEQIEIKYGQFKMETVEMVKGIKEDFRKLEKGEINLNAVYEVLIK